MAKANDDSNKTSGAKTDGKEKETAKKADFATRIGGAINKKSAEKEFGKAKARTVFDAVARAGRYGQFNDQDYNGGTTLAIPADNAKLRAKINEELKDLE